MYNIDTKKNKGIWIYNVDTSQNLKFNKNTKFKVKKFKIDNTSSTEIISINFNPEQFNPEQDLLNFIKKHSLKQKPTVKKLMDLLEIDKEEAENLL
jgi:hypothetical protein